MFARRLQKREGPLDVGLQERRGVEDGVVVVAFGGKMHDGIGIRGELVDELGVANVAVHEGHAFLR